MPNILKHDDHIPLHRLWNFTTLQDTLTVSEHAHVLDCDECRAAFQACLKGENFGAVLKELKEGKDKGSAEGS